MTPASSTTRATPTATLSILALGAVAYALAQTMIIPALPSIQDQYGASQETSTWLLTAFLVSSSVATPLLGRLGDMYGKEKLLLLSLLVFALGSLVSALAPSIAVLILGRVVQGAGGAIFPLAFGIIRDEFPRERVATSIGLISATFGIGSGLGLVFAGLIVDHASVSIIFWFSLAVTAAAAWATWRYVPESPVRVPAKVDVGGGTLLSLTLATLLMGVSQGNAWGWTSPKLLALFAVSAVLLMVFIRYEQRVDEPLVDMKLMAERPVWSTNLAAFGVGFAMFGSYILIPQLVQLPEVTGFGFGETATVAGLVMLPSALVMLGAGPLSGWLGTRFGSKLPLAIGALIAGVAYIDLAALHATLFEIALAGVGIGIGIGMAYAAMANLVVSAVKQHQTGVATGINTIMRSIGGAVGAQVSASLLASETILGGRFPADSGFALAFLLSGLAAIVAMAATGLVPKRPADEAPGAVPVAPAARRAADREPVGAGA